MLQGRTVSITGHFPNRHHYILMLDKIMWTYHGRRTKKTHHLLQGREHHE